MTSNKQPNAPDALVGAPVIERLRRAGYVVVPVDPPDFAVGEVMAWTGCVDPNLAWEALNCALNWMGIEQPNNVDDLAALGAGHVTLTEWKSRLRRAERG